MRKPTNSAMGTVLQNAMATTYCGLVLCSIWNPCVVNLLGKVPGKQSVDKLECLVWDQVYTTNAIPVLSLAMCMVMDVVFPVNEKRCHQNCLGWCAGCKSVGSTWSGEASCGFALCSATEVGMPGSSNVASKVAARCV